MMKSATRNTLSWLCAISILIPATAILQSDNGIAQVRMTPRTMTRTAMFNCTNNRFTNGDFSNAPAGTGPGQIEYQHDQDIDVAVGWKAPWEGAGSLADLFSSTEQIGSAGQLSKPTSPDGNYAAIWIGNMNETDAGFREGMYNKLVTPIAANSGSHSFTFKTAALYTAGTGKSYVGVYGVKRSASDPLISAPTGQNSPANKNLYGAGKVVHLATVEIPAATPALAWQNQSVTFPTSTFGSLSEITHVMVTKADAADGAVTATQRRYMAFDDFCMQSYLDTGGTNTDTGGGGGNGTGGGGGGSNGTGDAGGAANTNCPGAGCTDQAYSTCCPPSANFKLSKMLASIQPNVGADHYLKFTLDAQLDAQMTAYGAYLKSLDPSYTGMAMTVRAFDGGSGNSAVISGGPLEPEKAIYWNAGSPSGVVWPAGDVITPATTRPVNNWIVIETVIWHTGPNRPWSLDCSIKRVAFRPQLVGGRTMPGSRGFSDYTGAPPAAAAKRPARR